MKIKKINIKNMLKNIPKTKNGVSKVAGKINIGPSTTLNAIVIILIIILGVGYWHTSSTLKETQESFASSTANLSQKISDVETILLANQEENLTLSEALEAAREKSEDLERQFDKVNDNVEELEKITTTDKELLQKYSKVFFLNEHYAPADLAKIDSEWTYDKGRTYEIHDDVWPYLEDMLEDAEDDGMNLQVISAFRSFSEQAILKGAYTVTYGAGTANQFSADQGYSEHQLGTTVDFTTPELGAAFEGFASTAEYEWLQENAHKYGFTLSYPKDNAYYEFEPWHWRFVGTELADDLYDDGEYFYDLSQREIDEYIADLFD
jgi:LAS superfamily LD-carboxypeptidase LdcB